MQVTTKQGLFYFFPVFFCFCLPFGSLLLSGIIVAWTVASFFVFNREKAARGFRRPFLWLLYAFFFVTLASALFSDDKQAALFEVEIRLGFLVIPYLFFCFDYPPGILRRCVVAFVSGCFFCCLYLIGRAFIYSVAGHPEYFFYTHFSFFIHAGYFAMYLVMAIVFVVVLYPRWFREQRPVIYSSWFFVAFFVTGIFLCASKMGIITFFVSLPLLTFYRLSGKNRLKAIGFSVASVVTVAILGALIFPSSFDRWSNMFSVPANVDPSSTESTAVRVLIWKESWRLAQENLLTGTGVGDANATLYKAYAQEGMTGAFTHRLNAHNQYLQTMIGLGLTGLFLLLACTAGQLIRALRHKHFLLAVFSLVILLNFLVESMLQASAGTLFFLFFVCFFNLADEEQLMSSPVRE